MKVPVLETHKMLVLSTSHVSKETSDSMATMQHESNWVAPCWKPAFYRAEGWMFQVPYDQDMSNVPVELARIFEFAMANWCHWVMLDGDGPIQDELQTFDW